ncbi:uncharacterized protein LOC116161895 [Photinus pyralis]|nr:uncharacterized protein LOC116161895 [Photinus pyralis]
MKFAYFVVAALAFQVASARPRSQDVDFGQFIGDNLLDSVLQKGELDKFTGNMDTMRKEVSETVKNSLPSMENVNKALVDASKSVADTIEQGTNSFNEYFDKNKPLIEKLVKGTSAKVASQVAYVKGVVVDAAHKGEAVRAAIKANCNALMQEVEMFGKSMEPHFAEARDHASKLAGTFFGVLRTAAERFRNDITKVLKAPPQTR